MSVLHERLSRLLDLATDPASDVVIAMERGFDESAAGQFEASDRYTFVVKINGGAKDRRQAGARGR